MEGKNFRVILLSSHLILIPIYFHENIYIIFAFIAAYQMSSLIEKFSENFTVVLQELDKMVIEGDWNQTLLWALTSIALLLQLFVLWLIYAKSSGEMSEYRFYLAGITVRIFLSIEILFF